MANTADGSDPIEQIADALSRLRGRGPKPPWADGAGPWQGPRGAGRGMPPWADPQRADAPRGPRADHGGHHHPPSGMHGRMAGMARFRLLEALAAASAPLSVSELAEAIGVDQPRASRLVQQGVDHGLVRREADPDDARRTRIVLTEIGSAIVRRFRDARRGSIDEALASFTDAERAELARLLVKLADAWPRG
mgnify:CR=1 FL=1